MKHLLLRDLSNVKALDGVQPNLVEILDSRDRRQKLQRDLIKKHSCSLLSLSLICPGGIKNNIVYQYVFNKALVEIDNAFNKEEIIERKIENLVTGNYALYAIKSDALNLKEKAIFLENATPLARLWDIDIIDKSNKIISRTQFGHATRKCLICDLDAKICSRNRSHTTKELLKKIQILAIDDFLSSNVADRAHSALIEEVMLSPKPGLVDPYSNGAHTDMDIAHFKTSANAIKPFLYNFVMAGIHLKDELLENILPKIRKTGIDAEKAMFDATNGVNTHKGSVFSFGLVCFSIGYLYKNKEKITVTSICDIISKVSINILDDFKGDKKALTAGEIIYKNYNISGARGEALSGFETVRSHSLPFLKRYFSLDKEHAYLLTLLHLIRANNDTNVINRGGIKGLDWIKERASLLLADKKIYANLAYLKIKMLEFDTECIEKNISPGGSADLFALSCFLNDIDFLNDMRALHISSFNFSLRSFFFF